MTSSATLNRRVRWLQETFHGMARRPWIRHHTVLAQLFDYWHPRHHEAVAEYFEDCSDFWLRSVSMSDAIDFERLMKLALESEEFDGENIFETQANIYEAFKECLRRKALSTDGNQLLVWSVQ